MKKGWVFLLGFIAGVIVTFVVAFIVTFSHSGSNNSNITLSEQQTEFTTSSRFEVFQVIEGGALAKCEEKLTFSSYFSGPVVYIVADGQNQFYDEQVIEVPKGKKAMQIGTYRYQTKESEKVVPAIKIE